MSFYVAFSTKRYLCLPPGFDDPLHPYHVCILHKALYGLKQAPRAWFHRFSSFLLHFGFTQSKANSSLCIFRCPTHTIILLLYVDDIVVTGSSSSHLGSFIQDLGHEFDIKDLGALHHFLGLEVRSSSHGLHISQTKYGIDLLRRSNMVECKPC